MSNKYIDVICSDQFGVVDSKRDQQLKSAGVGLMLGAVALVAIPAMLMASEGSMTRSGSRIFDWFKAREQRRAQADKRSMQTLMQGRDRMSSSSKQQRDERMRRMFAAM